MNENKRLEGVINSVKDVFNDDTTEKEVVETTNKGSRMIKKAKKITNRVEQKVNGIIKPTRGKVKDSANKFVSSTMDKAISLRDMVKKANVDKMFTIDYSTQGGRISIQGNEAVITPLGNIGKPTTIQFDDIKDIFLFISTKKPLRSLIDDKGNASITINDPNNKKDPVVIRYDDVKGVYIMARSGKIQNIFSKVSKKIKSLFSRDNEKDTNESLDTDDKKE